MATPSENQKRTQRLADKAKDVMVGLVGRVSARTTGSQFTGSFIRNAALSDLYEIEAATIAIERAQSPRVREIAQQMIDDHTTSTHQLRSALRMNETRGEASAPEDLDARRKKLLDSLRTAPSGEFDKTYLDQQVLAHKEVGDLMTLYRDRGKNAQLRSVAAATAPVVGRHLRHMEALRDQLAG